MRFDEIHSNGVELGEVKSKVDGIGDQMSLDIFSEDFLLGQ